MCERKQYINGSDTNCTSTASVARGQLMTGCDDMQPTDFFCLLTMRIWNSHASVRSRTTSSVSFSHRPSRVMLYCENDIIQIWTAVECNGAIYCTVKRHIAQGQNYS